MNPCKKNRGITSSGISMQKTRSFSCFFSGLQRIQQKNKNKKQREEGGGDTFKIGQSTVKGTKTQLCILLCCSGFQQIPVFQFADSQFFWVPMGPCKKDAGGKSLDVSKARLDCFDPRERFDTERCLSGAESVAREEPQI